MTIGNVGGGFRAGLLERLFTRADTDQNQSVGVDELAGLMTGDDAPARARAILSARDADGDDQLTLAELTGGKLAPETLSGLLSVQEYAAADRAGRAADDRKAVDEFFASADLDGNGQLSKEEFDAERALRMAQNLDSGEPAPQHMFGVFRQAFDDKVITRDELMVGRRLVDLAKPISLDDPNLDPELAERLKKLAPLQAEAATSQPPRPDLSAVMGNGVRSAELTQALISRLIRQLELAHPAPPTQDLTA